MLRKIRTILAGVVFVLITLLFLDFTGTLHHWLSWLAKIQFLPAVMALNVVVVVALLVLTLVFGRIYCSIICPLGVFQDVLARIRRKKNKYSYSKEVKWLRYPVLVVFIIAAVAGIGSLFQLLAPYSAYGRIATTIFQPIWKLGNNVLAEIAARADSYAFYSVDTWMRSLPVLIIAVVTLVVLFVLAWRGGRTYCNTICPVGTILSFFARFSWLKIHFDEDKCKNCSMCSKNCKAACIDFKNHQVDYSRCVVCGNCIDSCKFGALKYSSGLTRTKTDRIESPSKSVESDAVDTSKRSFLLASAMVAGAAMAQKKEKLMDGGLAELESLLPFQCFRITMLCGIPGYRARIRPIVSRITIHWPSFYNVVTGKTLALPNLIALQHIPLSPAGVIAKRPAPIALPNSCAAEWRMAPDAVFSPYASVRYFTPHMVHSQYNLL